MNYFGTATASRRNLGRECVHPGRGITPGVTRGALRVSRYRARYRYGNFEVDSAILGRGW
jgi:hypothetical protein